MLKRSSRAILFAMAVFTLIFALTVAVWQNQHRNWQDYQRAYFQQTGQPANIQVRQITPQLSGQAELCLTCHIGLTEISPSHPVKIFGCLSCHGGNGLSLNKEQAHANLRGGKNPSDLAAVQESCGQGCHSGFSDEDKNHVDRVLRSLQGTYAGAIANVRFSFGAQANPTPRYGAYGVTDDNPAAILGELTAFPRESDHPVDRKFAKNCLDAGCHLSEKAQLQPYYYRSTGCAACHVLYANDGLYQGNDPTIPRDEAGHPRLHQLTTAIPFTQCNHCHNRGNYSLRQMKFLPRNDIPPAGPPISRQMPAEGRRLIEYYQPVGQFTLCEWELDCIDCHTAREAMGDGRIHPNQQEMQYTQCKTCHGTLDEPPAVATVTAEDQSALRQARLNSNYDLSIGDQVVITEQGELMGHIKRVGNDLILTGKATGKTYTINPVLGSGCKQKVDEQESRYCHECHAYAR